MMVATLFAFQQQRNIMQTRLQMVRSEVATAATGVAVDRLEEIGAVAFDDATKSEDKVFSPAGLTSMPTFTDDAPPVDDIDDFNGSFVQRFRVYAGDTLWYGVETTVRYASEAQPDIVVLDPMLRTKFKKATVKVYSQNVARVDTISLSQSFSCGSMCDW